MVKFSLCYDVTNKLVPTEPVPDLDLAAASTGKRELNNRFVLIKSHSIWALEGYSLM